MKIKKKKEKEKFKIRFLETIILNIRVTNKICCFRKYRLILKLK